MRAVSGLVVWFIICFAAAAFGSLFEPGVWYAALAKPRWTPPAWVFAPVWSVLYALMAVAAWRVWLLRGYRGAPWAIRLFLLQLVLNGLWSALFFGAHWPGVALLDLSLLWLVLIATTVAFYAHDRLAGALLVPYLVWISFAWMLNLAVWQLNR